MFIYHPRGVFLVGSGWFDGKILYFITQIRVNHILFTEGSIQTMLQLKILMA